MAEVTKVGNLIKKIHCNNCFSILSWDDVEVERTMNGNRYIVCPECGVRVPINRFYADYSGDDGGDDDCDCCHWLPM